MRHAETVTFGGSGFDRADALRRQPDVLADLAAAAAARAIVMWRGKPLIAPADPAGLVRLPMDHPVLAEAAPGPMFLGLEGGAARFAYDLSAWTPPDLDTDGLNGFLDPTEQCHPMLSGDHAFAELRRVMTWLSPRDAEMAATAKAIIGWNARHGFCANCGERTRTAVAGWQRVCPICQTSHFPRTDPVAIMLITHGNSVLLGRSPGWPEGMYSLLAGFVEPGESLESAVRREVFEEAGVRVGAVRYLASQPWPFPQSLMFGCAGEAETTEITIDPAEIEDALWVSREDVMQAFAGEHPTILPARKGAIAHFLLANWLADTLE